MSGASSICKKIHHDLKKNLSYFHFIAICFINLAFYFIKKPSSFNLEQIQGMKKAIARGEERRLYYHFPDTVMQSDRNCAISLPGSKLREEVCT